MLYLLYDDWIKMDGMMIDDDDDDDDDTGLPIAYCLLTFFFSDDMNV